MCTFTERSFCTPANRVLAAAAAKLYRLGFYQRRDIDPWVRKYSSWGIDPRDLSTTLSELERGRFRGSRAYYQPAIALASLILGGGSPELDLAGHGESGALLCNTADLFERYVRRLVVDALTPSGLVVSKGAQSPLSLFLDGSIELVPDVVVTDGDRPVLIVDAKYKKDVTVDAADAYQLYAYARVYGLDRVVVVSPQEGEGEEPLVVKKRMHSGVEWIRVFISLKHWKATEEWLAAFVLDLT
ncbi:MAG: hypothetical protein AMXMBFR34_48110 [Myxococcaceae bacterium]